MAKVRLQTSAAWAALLLCSGGLGAPASAQDRSSTAFALPALPLGQALREVALRTGRNLIVDDALVASRSAPSLSGRYGAEEAVAKLLVGSGLYYRLSGETIIITAAPQRLADRLEPAQASADSEIIIVYGNKCPRRSAVELVSTAEAMLDRRLAELGAEEREALEIDLSPREYVTDYLTAAFPTRQMRVFTDADGNARSEPMSDEAGHPLHSQAALQARGDLIEQLCAMPPIGTALDTLLERFGTDTVAEVTGRSRRLIVAADGRRKLENRTARSNLVETDAFMRGDKRILIFSDAGGTGRS